MGAGQVQDGINQYIGIYHLPLLAKPPEADPKGALREIAKPNVAFSLALGKAFFTSGIAQTAPLYHGKWSKLERQRM